MRRRRTLLFEFKLCPPGSDTYWWDTIPQTSIIPTPRDRLLSMEVRIWASEKSKSITRIHRAAQ